jgi:hypothetical protein
MVLFLKICAKNLNALCPEWFEKQDDKKMKESERRCRVDDDISELDCEGLRAILLLKEVRIRSIMGLFMTIIVLALRRRLKPTLGVFFLGMLILRKSVLVIHLS